MVPAVDRRVAIVTGGARGIGLAIAAALQRSGHPVAVVDRDRDALDAAASRLDVIPVRADLERSEEVRGVLDAVLAQLGPPLVLVNNAGFQHVAAIDEFPETEWRRMLEVMVTAPFLLTKAVWPHMREANWGRIVNIGSVHSIVASPFKVGYVTAKHALLGLTRAAATEGGANGITVNVVCPAYVRTHLVDAQIASQAERHGLSEQEVVARLMLEPASIKRLIDPAEVASVVSYLVSDEAAAVTGAAWTIDLGWTAR